MGVTISLLVCIFVRIKFPKKKFRYLYCLFQEIEKNFQRVIIVIES
jgi:hypothetical protein